MVSGLVHDRRRAAPADERLLRGSLNEAQRGALRALEYFGWTLGFVRNPSTPRPVHQRAAPMPVMLAPDNTFLVVRADGSIDDRARLELRRPSAG